MRVHPPLTTWGRGSAAADCVSVPSAAQSAIDRSLCGARPLQGRRRPTRTSLDRLGRRQEGVSPLNESSRRFPLALDARLPQVKISRDRVSPRHIATLCGPPFTELEIIAIADEVGLEGRYNRYGRRDVRYIIAKLMVRASEPEVVERLARVYQSFTARQE